METALRGIRKEGVKLSFIKRVNELEKKFEFYEDKKIMELTTEEIEEYLEFKQEVEELSRSIAEPLAEIFSELVGTLVEIIKYPVGLLKEVFNFKGNDEDDISKTCEYCGTKFVQGYYFEERFKYNHVCQDCVNKHEDMNEFAKCLHDGTAYWTDWSED